MASEITGLGRGEGGLKKLTILYEKGTPGNFRGETAALFNPGQLEFTQEITYNERAAAGQDDECAQRQYETTQPQVLRLDLFFDSYETHSNRPLRETARSKLMPTNPIVLANEREARPVTDYTERIALLGRVDPELHRPPVCQLRWGRFEIMRGVLTHLVQTFTMFLADGTPVRATLNCTFTQQGEERMMRQELHSADIEKKHIVRRGETLQAIAAMAYGTPARWRPIATANGILNPRRLEPGQVLRIPRLDGGGGAAGE